MTAPSTTDAYRLSTVDLDDTTYEIVQSGIRNAYTVRDSTDTVVLPSTTRVAVHRRRSSQPPACLTRSRTGDSQRLVCNRQRHVCEPDPVSSQEDVSRLVGKHLTAEGDGLPEILGAEEGHRVLLCVPLTGDKHVRL